LKKETFGRSGKKTELQGDGKLGKGKGEFLKSRKGRKFGGRHTTSERGGRCTQEERNRRRRKMFSPSHISQKEGGGK